MKAVDLTGQKFGMLTAIGRRLVDAERKWYCECECGGWTAADPRNLRSGNSKSCGCRKKWARVEANATHWGHGTRTYTIWKAMRARCNNPKALSYHNYGGRGIKVCARWNNYAAFLADMGLAPDDLTLDRIDNNGDYEASNCRWATYAEQARNKRGNVWITHAGITDTQSGWAKRLGVWPSAVHERMTKKGTPT